MYRIFSFLIVFSCKVLLITASDASLTTGTERRVNTYLNGDQRTPSVARLTTGGLVIVWYGEGPTDSVGVYGQLYDSSFTPLNSQFVVSAETSEYEGSPSVASLTNGGFIVVWYSVLITDSDVYGRLYDSMGIAMGNHFLINTYTTDDQETPDVAGLTDGTFVVTWQS